MSGQSQPMPYSFTAGEALAEGRFVKMSGSTSRTVVYADAGEEAIGVTLQAVASGDKVAVQGLNTNRTLRVVAAGNYAVNAAVYVANDGKVSTAASGRAIGFLLDDAAADGQFVEMFPLPTGSGNVIDQTVMLDYDFEYWPLDESGSEGPFVLDANNGGAVAVLDAHGGVITLTASDTTAGDNDESYIISASEIFKPQAGKKAMFKARIKFTEANTDDASVLFGLISHDTDVENTIADGGATIADADTFMGFLKSDGGTVYKGIVRDSAIDTDADVGARVSGSFQELMLIWDGGAAGAATGTVYFLVDGVAGGSLDFTIANATDMRLILGIKNGGANAETLHIDRVAASFDR